MINSWAIKPKTKKNKARQYVCTKFNPRDLAKKNGKKKVSDAGIPITILLANKIVLSKFLCSAYENAIDSILSRGNAIIKPARTGFLMDSQLAKEIIMAENNTFAKKMTISSTLRISQKSFWF